ncbi:hypothetical protein L195_g052671 [Trifolium pratense]|uniref:Uncharacterized protein n=1 Tax=Trifolium pratense TaxID=57577 RepID=A0A2K3K6G6_TRIPR|nr:hypothetical protein L195_g052671 [Trifolium pratense]
MLDITVVVFSVVQNFVSFHLLPSSPTHLFVASFSEIQNIVTNGTDLRRALQPRPAVAANNFLSCVSIAVVTHDFN